MRENQNVEFKRLWKDEYLKWICGYANSEGGILYIGIDDEGTVFGLQNAAKLLADIPNKVRDTLGIIVNVNLHTDPANSLSYLEIIVDPHPFPVNYKGAYHYRSGSTKQELKGAALDRFLLSRQGRHWDSVPVPNVHSADLSSAAFERFIGRVEKSHRMEDDVAGIPHSELLERLHLFEGDYLKRAALLLFHPEPQRFVGGAVIRVGFFRDDANLLYHDEINGDVIHQIETVMDLLFTKYLKALVSYSDLQRTEQFPIPRAAMREVLLNAVIHKDYAAAAPIQISVYDNKLMCWNPGDLPTGWTVKTLMTKHPSIPANPDIANALFRAGMVETWGRGIEKVLQACATEHLPFPKFSTDGTGLWVEFTFPAQDTSQEITGEITGEIILNLIRKNPRLTQPEIAKILHSTPDSVKYQMDKLKKQGLIRHEGPTKKGNWIIEE
jgi:ATP-dependent DNA helicase RecG